MGFNEDIVDGKVVRVGNKLCVMCSRCHKIVQLNKFIFGALHFCTAEEEPAKKEVQTRLIK